MDAAAITKMAKLATIAGALSNVGVPMIAEIIVQYDTDYPFSPEDVELIADEAARIGVAMFNEAQRAGLTPYKAPERSQIQ